MFSYSKQTLIGFHSDIVKVRLQTTQQYSSALDAATQIFKNEGPAAFYKVSGGYCFCWFSEREREMDYRRDTVGTEESLFVGLGDVNSSGGNWCLCK